MAQAVRRDERGRPLPPPLPPAERTVGQLVAEAIRLYGARFWRVMPLGLSVAVLDQALTGRERWVWLAAMLTAGALVMTASYVAACVVALGLRPSRATLARAYAVGVAAFVPFPLLMLGFVLPGIAWLAFVGLAVPVALAESTGFRGSFARATRLARADYVHALGSLATLVLVYFLTRTVLVLLLRGQGEQTERIAVFLGDLVLSPVLFVGAALLYRDQAARAELAALESRRRRA